MHTIQPSLGKCIFCQKTFSKVAMARHLGTHLQEKTASNKAGKSFHIKIETAPRWGSTPYFIHLWVDGKTPLYEIDTLLRQIWLECCGHLSNFSYSKVQFGGQDDIDIDTRANKIFRKDLKLNYEYDYGSTTELQVTVVKEYAIAADLPIVLLTRNEPLPMLCSMCGQKNAARLCTVCENDNAFCESCSKKHREKCGDFDDYASAKVTNSPRMGVCVYNGGRIDVERD